MKMLMMKKVGTPKIESMARRYVSCDQYRWQGISRRNVEEVVRILRGWVRQEEKFLKVKWMIKKRKREDLEKMLGQLDAIEDESADKIKKKVEEETAKEVQRYQMTFERVYNKKVIWLMYKYKRTEKKAINPRWKGVKVSNEQVKEETDARGWKQETKYIVLDEIELDEDEKEYANLPHKFREYNKVDILDMELCALCSSQPCNGGR